MNPDQQRIAIAEACGWKHRLATDENPVIRHGMRLPCTFGDPIEAFWHDSVKGVYSGPPDYLNDLNAMDEAENFMKTWSESDSQAYRDYISVLRALVPGYPESATASQRAEAFLRTIGKWPDKSKRHKPRSG